MTEQQENLPESTKQAATQKLTPWSHPWIIISLLAFIVSFIAIFEVAYFYSQTHKKLDQQALEIKKQDTQLVNSQKQEQFFKTDLQQKNTEISTLKSQLAALTARIDQSGNALQNQMLNFRLNQIRQLLEQAQLSLQFTKQFQGALSLLQIAQQRLGQINQPEMLPVQQALAQTILAVRSIPLINQANLLSQLNALNQKVSSLPLTITQFKFDAEQISEPQAGPHTPHWKLKIKEALGQFKGLIIIRHHEQPFEPMLPPAQEAALQENLSQLFNQASWAVLHLNQAVYQNSLKSANDLLNRYYPASSPDVMAIHQEISQLATSQIEPQVPNLESLLQLYLAAEDKIHLRTGISG